MHRATPAAAPSPRLVRRLVLCGAALLAVGIALSPRPPGVHAQDRPTPPVPPAPPAAPKTPGNHSMIVKDGEGGSATVDIRVDKGKKTVTIEKSVTKDGADGSTADEDTDTTPILGIGSRKSGKGIRVGVFGDDRDFESVSDFAHSEPGLAFMVVMIVAVVFLSPVLAIALILGYRMRKARMLNETMLKLAEKGVVPPAEALGALAGTANASFAAAPSAAPIYEQAKQIRRRAAWSDLRRGVLLGGFGLGLTCYSMFDDGSPNGIGLVLLFVGVGYIILWWFEDRQSTPRFADASTGVPPPPPGGTGGIA